ncbi:MAG: hypothetical protein ACKVQV_07360 [Bacteroidia bacterium]
MKNITLGIFIYCLCLLSWSSSYAQGNEVGLFVGNIPGKTGVQVKWFSKNVNLDATYNVYRKESSETNWIKVNSTAIQRSKTMTQTEIAKSTSNNKNDSAYVLYNSVMNRKEEDKQLKSFLLASLVMQSIRDNKLAAHLGIYFEDLSAQSGKTYVYRLTTVEKEKELALSMPIKVETFIKGTAPEKFQLKAMDASVQARWIYKPSCPMYKIQRSSIENGSAERTFFCMPSQDALQRKDTAGYFFTDNDSTLQNGKSYYYKVSSLDYFGNESTPSSALKTMPKDQTAPSPIQGLTATTVEKKVKLSWKKSNEADVKGYSIYRSLNKDDGFKKISTAPLLKEEAVYMDASISESSNYFYYVEAEDKSGNASRSMVIPFTSMDLTAPVAPTNIVARADTGKIYLSWNRNAEVDIAGYYIYYAIKDEPSNYNLLNKKPITTTSFVDTLPKELSNYFIYKVAAADVNYNIGPLSMPVYVRMPDVMPPSTPVIKNSFVRGSSIVITWLKPSLNNLKGFMLQRKADVRSTYTAVNKKVINASDTSYVDDEIEKGKNYTYQLIAIDSSNNLSEASLPMTILYTSSGVVKAPGNVVPVYDDGKKEVRLNWSMISQPDNFKGYIVFRKEKGGNYFPLAEASVQPSFVDTTVVRNTIYFYKVSAMDIDGALIPGTEEKEINCRAK